MSPLSLSISGLDGCGKTSVMDAIEHRLSMEGTRYRREWLRFSHVLSLPVLAWGRAFGYARRVRPVGRTPFTVHEYRRNRGLAWTYAWTSAIDMVFACALRVALPRAFKCAVLADRFVYDTIVDISVMTGIERLETRGPGRMLLRLVPRGHVAVYLRASPAVLGARRPENLHDANFTRRHAEYERLATVLGMAIVNAEDELDEVRARVEKLLMEGT